MLGSILQYFEHIFLERGFEETLSKHLGAVLNTIVLIFVAILLGKLLRRVFVQLFFVFSRRTKTSFDNFLFKTKFPKYAAHLLLLLVFRYIMDIILLDIAEAGNLTHKVLSVYLVVLITYVVRSFVRSTKNYLKSIDNYKDKPIDSFAQVIITILWIISTIVAFSIVIDESILHLLTGLGAISAVILLVFKDTILGFVASVQVSAYDIVRIGDWITLEKFGADGTVIEINITTVKVKNFDNTISTIPTYSLISDSFKNWRGMLESSGRRISRCLYISQSSVKFMSEDDLKKFKNIQVVENYISHRQKDIDHHNKIHNFKNHINQVNGRNQTNLGLFRKYCDLHLESHPAVNKKLIIMTRHLEPTPYGIPLELYFFCNDKRWVNYERIMADIFEHIIAATSYFELEILEIKSDSPKTN